MQNKQTAGHEECVTEQAQITRRLSTVPVAPNLAYFRLEYSATFGSSAPANLQEYFKSVVSFGFARPADLAAFADDEATEIPEIRGIFVTPPGFREIAQKEGFPVALQHFQEYFQGPKDILAELREGSVDVEDILHIDIGSHMLFDRQGQVLPVGLVYDYLTDAVSSDNYDLSRALPVLLADPRIHPRQIRKDKAEQVEITRVSATYNCDSDSLEHIAFVYAPTAEDMTAIWAKCQAYDTKYPSTMMRQAVFDLDLLGLRAAGAAKSNNFYGPSAE